MLKLNIYRAVWQNAVNRLYQKHGRSYACKRVHPILSPNLIQLLRNFSISSTSGIARPILLTARRTDVFWHLIWAISELSALLVLLILLHGTLAIARCIGRRNMSNLNCANCCGKLLFRRKQYKADLECSSRDRSSHFEYLPHFVSVIFVLVNKHSLTQLVVGRAAMNHHIPIPFLKMLPIPRGEIHSSLFSCVMSVAEDKDNCTKTAFNKRGR